METPRREELPSGNRRAVFLAGTLIVIVSFVGLAATSRDRIVKIRHDGHMHFPLQPLGTFVQHPHIETRDGQRSISWILPGRCNLNEYQTVTDDYVEDKFWSSWLGGSPSSCAAGDDGTWRCEMLLTSEMDTALQEGHSLWFVAKASVCKGGVNHAISERLIISP